jgi:predicted helicase
MQQLNLKPTHAPVKAYYQALGQYGQLNIDHEMAVRSAFQNLLEKCGSQFHWTLIAEFPIRRPRGVPLKVDGAMLDEFRLKRGFWEAKDEHDDLEREAKRKITAGYPTNNIIFQAPERAILYQNGLRQGLNEDISNPDNLVDLLHHFFEYREPQHEEWEEAVAEFKERLPEIAAGAKQLIENEREKNSAFVQNFEEFYALCRQAINPNLSVNAVEGMLIQHLLTERIFRKIFDNPDFSRRNVIAQEIEKVIASLTSRHFNREIFLQSLDRFYKAIEANAVNTKDYAEKQEFLNTVYERFFRGYSPKEADTHGVVYTPQPIVNFMVRSVQDILQKEFGSSLSDKEVHILDPFVGTGNFITRVMREIKKTALPYKYENELHCNELMLMPYYIASMNIEHAYLEATGEYRPFPGICLVDTFELAEPRQAQLGFMTEENTKRVAQQKQSPIFVIIGNPPYNAKQVDENDNNRNRKYETLDEEVANTYVRDSKATLRVSLGDPYIKAFRWSSNRLGQNGILALVTNNGFVDGLAADGVRAHLMRDFDAIYILDLGGNVRKNPKLSGSTHNVFGIQVGVSINLLVRKRADNQPHSRAHVFYARVEEFWHKEEKYEFLEKTGDFRSVKWREVKPTADARWLSEDLADDFSGLISIGSKAAKRGTEGSIFETYCNGAKSNSDAYVYRFNDSALHLTYQTMVTAYNEQLDRWRRAGRPKIWDVEVDETKLKWIRHTKKSLARDKEAAVVASNIRSSLYRPFARLHYIFDPIFNEDLYQLPNFFPHNKKNIAICVNMTSERPFACIATSIIPNLVVAGGFGCTTQCFPFFLYDEGGTNVRANITDRALEQFRNRYKDGAISKWDIFHYVYGVLHHPIYRERYAANLRRDLPRIPFAPSFHQMAAAGKLLVDLHVKYEEQPEFELEQVEKPGEKLNLQVKAMQLSEDKTAIVYNDFLTIKGIPPESFQYCLGNRSALEWVIDQYQVSTDTRSGIVNNPNRPDDPEYILRLIGQVVTVSLETNKIVHALPTLGV